MVLDNCYDAATAIRNAEEFVKDRVDLVIEFQVEQEAAPVIADNIAAARIPLIAIDIPHPHAIYFGVDNYRVGYEAGVVLAAHALSAWNGQVNWVLGLDLPEAGPLVQSRITGAFEGVRSGIPDLPVESFVRIDGRGMRDRSRQLISTSSSAIPETATSSSPPTPTPAPSARSTPSANASARSTSPSSARTALPRPSTRCANPGSPFIGSVSHEANAYGPSIIQLGLALLRGQTVPPYNYVQHKMVTPQSLANT